MMAFNSKQRQILKLRPDGYFELTSPIVFHPGRTGLTDEQVRAITQSKSLVISAYRRPQADSWTYTAYIGTLCFNFYKNNQGRFNFNLSYLQTGDKFNNMRNRLYRDHIDTMTIITQGKVAIVYNGSRTDGVDDWNMDEAVFRSVVSQLEKYFDEKSEEAANAPRDRRNDYTHNNRYVETNVLEPFEHYTNKEDFVEREVAAFNSTEYYYKSDFFDSTEKTVTYAFFCDPSKRNKEFISEDSDNALIFADESQVNIDLTDGEMLRGTVVSSYETEVDDIIASVYNISFMGQIDNQKMPQTGRITPAVNNTQTRVRERVLRTIRSSTAVSKYMYRTFKDFTVDGYDEPTPEMVRFIVESLKEEYPPNQMQLEAIIKGILTKDMLLVLGPPGTGKTTVIRKWTKYFIQNGMRVLISSQNNAAVDNVLQAFTGDDSVSIVRLGNENKVLPVCHEFLPENRIHEMRTHFRECNDGSVQAIRDDLSEIERYKQEAGHAKEVGERYGKITGSFLLKVAAIKSSNESLRELYDDFTASNNQLNGIYNEMNELREIIQNYENSSAIMKLFRSFKAKKSRKRLDSLTIIVENVKVNQRNTIEKYNNGVTEIKKMLAELKNSGEFERVENVRREFFKMSQSIVSGIMFPNIRSLVTTLALPQRPSFNGMKFDSYDFSSSYKKFTNVILVWDNYVEQCEPKIRQTLGALDKWYEHVLGERNDALQDILIDSCDLVGATCIGINSKKAFADVKFDVAIIDESGQIQIHNALVPMSRAPKLLMLGDYKQIPPIANDDVIAACEAENIKTELLNESFFEYLFKNLNKASLRVYGGRRAGDEVKNKLFDPLLPDYDPKPYMQISESAAYNMINAVTADHKKTVNLNSQFRMPGNISDIISEWFYNSNYFSSYNMTRFKPVIPNTQKPMIVLDTSDEARHYESRPANNAGYLNTYEAELIADIVEKIIDNEPLEERENFIKNIDKKIGVISAYGGQVRAISSAIRKRKLGIGELQLRGMVASLDSFQGQERPLILYSFTRSDSHKSPSRSRVGFMKELRRLNVAFTRCKMQLAVIGDMEYLTSCENIQHNDDEEYPCKGCTQETSSTLVGINEIKQCEECELLCERKFSRFIRLMLQHVYAGAGERFASHTFKKTFISNRS